MLDLGPAADARPAQPAASNGSVSPAARLIAWQRAHGRHGLPWQHTRDPYRIWLSEVMLQQTQAATVVPYYERFVARFADVGALAAADLDEVIALWSGLGYYSRARNLHACARRIVAEFGGRFPASAAALAGLPGIGRSTAAAIAAFAFGERVAILDGNVRRVLARLHGLEGPVAERAVETRLWALAEAALPPVALTAADADAMAVYTQAQMDLGALVCVRTRPHCAACPLADDCVARRTGRTHELPTPRVRRATPQREVAMLAVRRAGTVLVERRAPSGIWGGLWSLPESTAADPAAVAAEEAGRFGWRAVRIESLAPFEHAFTHFRLRVRPWLVEVAESCGQASAAPIGQGDGVSARHAGAASGSPASLQAPSYRWLSAPDVAAAGLPQPVKRLLGAIAGCPASAAGAADATEAAWQSDKEGGGR